MRYSIAKPEDLSACNDCIASTGYYDPVDLRERGGIVLLARDEEGEVAGCVWAVTSGKWAYTDLLAVAPKYQGTGVGPRLIAKGLAILRLGGVKEVKSMVHAMNGEADKLNRKLASKMDGPYFMSTFHIGDKHG